MASIQYGKYGTLGKKQPPDTFLYNAATLAANTGASALQGFANNFGVDLAPLGIEQHELTQDWAKKVNPITNAGANFLYGTGTQMLMSQLGGMNNNNTSYPTNPTEQTFGDKNNYTPMQPIQSKGFNNIPLQNQNNPLSKFQDGGMLNEFNGLPHELGGIPLSGNAEVEDKETMYKDYIFSNNLMYDKNKTFADVSKKIKNKYKLRDGDVWAGRAMERELNSLAAKNESFKEATNSTTANKYANGGLIGNNNMYFTSPEQAYLYSNNPSLNLGKFDWNTNIPNTLLGQLSNTPAITPKSNPGKGGDITLNDIYPAPIFNTIPDFKTQPKSDTLLGQVSKGYTIGGNNQLSQSIQSPQLPQSGNPDVIDKENIWNNEYTLPMLGYAIQGMANNALLNVKPEYARYDRINPNLVNYAQSRDNMNRAKQTALAMTMRNPLNTSASGINAGISNILGAYGDEYNKSIEAQNNANAQIMNAVATQNAEIQMKESEANQMEKDAVRSAKLQGYSNIGQIAATANKTAQDIKQYNNYMDWLAYSNSDYTRIKEGGKNVMYRLWTDDTNNKTYYINGKGKKVYVN